MKGAMAIMLLNIMCSGYFNVNAQLKYFGETYANNSGIKITKQTSFNLFNKWLFLSVR